MAGDSRVQLSWWHGQSPPSIFVKGKFISSVKAKPLSCCLSVNTKTHWKWESRWFQSAVHSRMLWILLIHGANISMISYICTSIVLILSYGLNIANKH